MNSELNEAEIRGAFACRTILAALGEWIEDQAYSRRRMAAKRRFQGRAAEARMLCEQADALRDCMDAIKTLRKKSGELSERNRAKAIRQAERSQPKATSQADGNACEMYLPSPEEIAAECAKIQAEWTEAERKRRHWQSAQSVEMNPTNFVF